MNAEQFLDQLEGVRAQGGGWMAKCPSHSDRVASLSVAENGDKLLVCCQAGCPTESVVEAMGLTMRDLFYESARRDEPEAVYEYTDENGELLYEVVRYPGKQFKQRRCDPETRELIWGLDGTQRVLYKLPALIHGVNAGCTIYICEGERDVQALYDVGKYATCNPGGAGKWRDEYSEYLQGAAVIIVADKDEPGLKHAQQVARSLDGIAKSVHVVQARTGKDAADHLAAGHSVEEFVQVSLTDARRHYQPLDLFVPVPPVNWIVQDIVVGGEATLLLADGGAGKSFFALAMALAVASGEQFVGRATQQGKVVFIDEDGAPDLALQRLQQLGATDVQKRNLEYLSRQGIDVVQHPDRLFEDMLLLSPMLIVIDTHSRVTRGADENSNNEMGRLWTEVFQKLALDTGAGVLVIHHVNGSDGSRGASAIRDSADQSLKMTRQPDGSQIVWPDKPRRMTSNIHFEFLDLGDNQYRFVPYGWRPEVPDPFGNEWSMA